MTIFVKELGTVPYDVSYAAMREFNASRTAVTEDEIWLLEHPPVYTLGLSGKRNHLINTGTIPVVETDRGGQVTYHGPGQLVAYLLIDLSRRPYAVKRFVTLIEQAIIDYLQSISVTADRKAGAPGVYVTGKKIAALGVRVKKNGSYHGLALNVDMDLSPYQGINPCGYAGMECTRVKDFIDTIKMQDVYKSFPEFLRRQLDLSQSSFSDVA